MLIEKTLFETRNIIDEAIIFLKETELPEGFNLAFSGGKDSIVIKKLAQLAGVKYKAHYNVTTIDPPNLIYFIKKNYPDVIWNKPEKPLLVKMLEKGFPPLRQQRWCCELYKENNGNGRIITGIRKEESKKRSKRKMVEFCFKNKSIQYINPILFWSKNDIWDFIKKYNLKYCSLYNEGWERIGCLFCPCTSKKNKLREIKRYPNYVKLYIKYFQKLIDKRKKENKPIKKWKNGTDFFWWWINGETKKYDQNVLFE